MKTVANGGVTINLKGNVPAKGFAYSANKSSEFIVPKGEFRVKHIEDFIKKNHESLNKEGGHLGVWEENGNIYLDVSKVSKSSPEAIAEAQKAQQLAVFDLESLKAVDIGSIKKGVYTPIDEATNLFNQHRGQVRAGNLAGNAGGNAKVQIRPRDRIVIEPTKTNLSVERQEQIIKSLSKDQKGAYLTARNKALDVFPEFESSFNKGLKIDGVKTDFPANMKSDARAIEKVFDDATTGSQMDFTSVKDFFRGSYVVEKADAIPTVFNEIGNNFTIIRVKNRFKKPVGGYRDILVNVRMDNGVIGEIQIQTPALTNAKNRLHVYYEKQRELAGIRKQRKGNLSKKDTEMFNKVGQKMIDGYEKAWQADLERFPDLEKFTNLINDQ